MPETLYPFRDIESKWQKFWLENKTFKALEPANSKDKKKLYILDMFPYPSGSGLHVGHPEGYTATDIYSRYKRMCGFNVLHPMGWDAFGLPAEQYAIETGTHPAVTTQKNIATFKRQIQTLGLSYDWDREIDTTDREYVRWTQWIFLKLFNSYYDEHLNKAMPIELLEDALSEKPNRKSEWERNKFLVKHRNQVLGSAKDPHFSGSREDIRKNTIKSLRLALYTHVNVWWCEEFGCVLANEEVVDGKSERGGHPVVRRPMKQWILRITTYADRLLEDLSSVDWTESIKEMQRNWIGRSEGAEVQFKVDVPRDEYGSIEIDVFTTRPDTLFGATYIVLAPDSGYAGVFMNKIPKTYLKAVEDYRNTTSSKSELDRQIDKDKTGVFTGLYAINPVSNKKIPIWLADYVLTGYGTGAIMAVPAHDERDYQFATKFELPIVEVIEPPMGKVYGGSVGTHPEFKMPPFTGDGKNINSGFLNGLNTPEAKQKMIAWLEKEKLGKKTVNYKLRDWLFSRQRYWGEPIPLVHCAKCGIVPIPENELPLRLPDMKDFKPSGNAEPPLAKAKEWLQTSCPKCHGPAQRETNTMPQWAGSCWYYLRYIDPKNKKAFCDPAKEKYWMSVDLYVGGAEHAVLHLLYSRFWHKVLFDLGHVSTKEPFMKLVNQGMILGEDGQKMSKSRGNVINPDFVVENYGADSMRLYEMFMGPLTQMKSWSMKGVEGVYRFLGRIWRLYMDREGNLSAEIRQEAPSEAIQKLLHRTIKKVTEDLDELAFNTAISSLMIFSNELAKEPVKPKAVMKDFLLLLSPFAPHLAEELWEKLGEKQSLAYHPWPVYNPVLIEDNVVEIPIMINGKVKAKLNVSADWTESKVEAEALKDEKVAAALAGKTITHKKYVPKKIFTIATD